MNRSACRSSNNRRSAGISHTWNDVRDWCYAAYPHEDGGRPLPSFVNLVDSRDGNRKDEVFDFCMTTNKTSGPFVWPSMGARPVTMNLQLFRKLRIDHEKVVGKKATGRIIDCMHTVMVNTTFTQEWLDNTMVRRTAGDPKSLILPDAIIDDQDYFDQLLNERFNPKKGTWDRIDETTIPVDFRDCKRYARAAAEVYVNGTGHASHRKDQEPSSPPATCRSDNTSRQQKWRSSNKNRSSGSNTAPGRRKASSGAEADDGPRTHNPMPKLRNRKLANLRNASERIHRYAN